MPEGHEIHRFAERHGQAFAGRKVRVASPNGGFPEADLLDGRKLREVVAKGKHLGYKFGRDLTLHVHLGQYGDFWEGEMPYPEPKGALRMRMWVESARRGKASEGGAKHASVHGKHEAAALKHGPIEWIELRGPTDCSIFSDEEWQALEARLGPDPLDPEADPAEAIETMTRKKTPIGVLLMDQRVWAGVGNVYRAELLFRARIHPDRPGRDVPAETLRSIWRDTVGLMRAGMVDRRMVTTRREDRPHPKGKALKEEAHYVYRRQGKPCRVCGTEIEMKPMAGRTVYWCPVCQPA